MKHHKIGFFTWVWLILVGFTAALGIVSWCSPSFCDWYTDNIFPVWTNSYGRLTSRVPFSFGECMIAAGILWLVVLAVVTLILLLRRLVTWHRHNDIRYLGFAAFVKGFWAATMWIAALVFLVMTLNCIIIYHCSPLEQSLPGYGKEYDLEALTGLRELVVQKVNTLAEEMPRDSYGNVLYGRYASAAVSAESAATDSDDDQAVDSAASDSDSLTANNIRQADADEETIAYYNSGVAVSAFAANTERDMQEGARAATARLASDPLYQRFASYQVVPKRLLASGYVSQQYMQGYYFPFSMEANYNELMEEMNKPFTMCHEIAHTHGYIYEDDANFLAFLACIRSGDPVFEYSGWLGILNYVNNDYYYAVSEEEYWSHTVISDQVWKDETFVSDAVFDQIEKKSALETEEVKQSADTYLDVTLKANGVSEGKLQYDHVVGLLLEYYDGDYTR